MDENTKHQTADSKKTPNLKQQVSVRGFQRRNFWALVFA
jgi:hypothetical protein